ncbi:MAG: hypothetical protein CMJ58_17080 [Planctomycetaceae bacterium]|nr:hypothetical protein [Planctomycetaceae bacterium]
MHKPVYCGHCGQQLQPEVAKVGAEAGGEYSNAREHTHYWCCHCEHAWPLPMVDRTEQLCEACDRYIPLGQSYCLYCGHHCAEPFASTSGLPADETPPLRRSASLQLGRTDNLFVRVARLLQLMNDQPNVRTEPLPGDRSGSYMYWFDGGACRCLTGGPVEFEFDDGSSATQWVFSDPFSVTFRLADGTELSLKEFATGETSRRLA